MLLATLFDHDSAYVPEGFGVLTTADNARDVVAAAYAAADSGEQVTADVPILMYHSFTENPEEVTATNSLISDFEAQLKALRDAGYTSVTYQQLIDFVTLGVDLPEKPVVITMDDGYRDNLTLAAPLLEEYGFTANVAVIGTSVGHSTYKDSDTPITHHFSLEEALPWVEKGVLSVTTHSYDMHQVASLDGENCRQGVLQMEGEREEAYIAALTEDYTKAQQQLTDVLGEVCPVYTYPYGFSSILSEVFLHDLGVQVTVTTEYGANQLLKGVPQSLYQLRRINVEGSLAADTLLDRIDLELGMNNRKLEGRMESVRRSRLLVDRLNDAVSILKSKPVNGNKMYDIIYMTFLGPDKLMHEELLYRLDISARHYYRLRTQAINIIALRLWSAPAGEVDSWLEVLSILENW